MTLYINNNTTNASPLISNSHLMYFGFKYTRSRTYDECISLVLGPKVGLFANLVVFVHVFGAVVSTWIFSYKFTRETLEHFTGVLTKPQGDAFQVGYFLVTALVMFWSASSPQIDRLKTVAIAGFFMLVYLLLLFVWLTPKYHLFYRQAHQFELEYWKPSPFLFKTYGLTQYLFLNQYSIIPLCHHLARVSHSRINHVVFRATCVLFLIYLGVMLAGYFSQPSISLGSGKLSELFILRPSLGARTEAGLVWGRGLFGLTLLIANLVKNHFFLLYFRQILRNYRVMRGEGVVVSGGAEVEVAGDVDVEVEGKVKEWEETSELEALRDKKKRDTDNIQENKVEGLIITKKSQVRIIEENKLHGNLKKGEEIQPKVHTIFTQKV